MNATPWRLYTQLQAIGLPVEGGSGGRTKKQRIEHGLPKQHYYDALRVGASTPHDFTHLPAYVQIWMAKGRGMRQLCRTDRYEFSVRHVSRKKQRFGFQTGDLVQKQKSRGKQAGTWIGRLTARPDGRFIVTLLEGANIDVSWRFCRLLQRGDGWQYTRKTANAEFIERGKAASSPA